jgi:hypothetical protein
MSTLDRAEKHIFSSFEAGKLKSTARSGHRYVGIASMLVPQMKAFSIKRLLPTYCTSLWQIALSKSHRVL